MNKKTLQLKFKRGTRGSLWVILLAYALNIGHAEDTLLIQNGQKIAFLGDSITANGWAQPGGYIKLIVDALAKQGVIIMPIPAGVSGNTSKDMLARVNRDVLSKKPDWMTLSCGVNDVWHGINGVSLDAYEQNITAIVSQAKNKGIKVVILTSTPIGEDDNANNQKLSAYNEFLRRLARERHLPLADLNADFHEVLGKSNTSPSSRILTVDGVHMNTEGNILMAKGCLRAFGLTDTQLDEVERVWLTQPNTAMFFMGSFDPRPSMGITLAQYRGLEKLAQSRNTSLARLSSTLWLQSLGYVMQAHAQDKLIDENLVKTETNLRLLKSIRDLTGE